ncbi:hypothetical protein Acor_72960 [Acrocarpospora corrugata]|uniref:Uncharacterized protein n=1 Tax=Acrocarpospora corrugata TaxID=35763 RepID=A0A5M3WFR7_9ACTN|nr:hypothetical protein [Acrocarpospora corrugata]GES05228.1 hypothetical protein Acor_72960 [Acrocarpospora corrugata]
MNESVDDHPQPLSACWNYWIAVSTGDQAGVMEILGLTEHEPVSFAAAEEIIDTDSHDGYLGRVFVTPEVGGWTLVMGAWCDPYGAERREDVLRLCTKLSERYGRAHAYYYGEQDDGSAWLVTENGMVVRRFAAAGEPGDELLALGEPLPVEQAKRIELGLPIRWDPAVEDDEEWLCAAFGLAPEIASALGVSPLVLTADTPWSGVGVLAATPCSDAIRRSSLPRG